MQGEGPEAAAQHISAYLDDVVVVCLTAAVEKVLQHMEAMLSEAGLQINPNTSMVWTASGPAPATPISRRVWEQAGRHDGFVLMETDPHWLSKLRH